MDDESPPRRRCARKLLERAEELRDVLLHGDEQEDDATRRAVIRGFDIVTHDYFKNLGDKLTPAAVIPVHTRDEATEELEFVTK